MKTHHHPPVSTDHAGAASDPLSLLRNFMDRNQPAILAGFAVVLIILIVLFIGQRREQRVRQAAEMLGRARNVEELEEIVDRYGRTPIAPLAMLQAARLHYETGALQRAADLYDRFLRHHPQHAFITTAVLGQLHCWELMGRSEDALNGFDRFIKDYPAHFLRPQAILGKARCLDQTGRTAEARIAYEDFITLNPDSRWVPQAEQALQNVNRRLRLAQQPAPTPRRPAPPETAPLQERDESTDAAPSADEVLPEAVSDDDA